MALNVRTLSLPRAATGLVVRPRPSGGGGGSSGPESPGGGGGPDQALLFTEDGRLHELLGCGSHGPSSSGDLQLGPPLGEPGASGGGGGFAHGGRCPVFDPATQVVWFLAGPGAGRLHAFPHHLMGTSSAGHGPHSTSGSPSSTGAPAAAAAVAAAAAAARLSLVSALAADGQGGLWVLDWGRIRRLDLRGKAVAMAAEAAGFEAAVPAAESGPWWHLACCGGTAGDAAEAVALLAATGTALCGVRTGPEGGGSGGLELLAGSWAEAGSVDGAGAAARFSQITALLPLPGTGRLLVADGPDLRCVDMSVPAGGGAAGGGGGAAARPSLLPQARRMALRFHTLQLRRKATGLAVRPRPSGGPDSSGAGGGPDSPDQQVLVFTEDGGVYELLGCGSGGYSSDRDLQLGPPLATDASPRRGGRHPTYDPATSAVYFCEYTVVGWLAVVSRLQPSNACSLVAGSKQHTSGQEKVFSNISSLVADGQGGLWVADLGSFRRLDTRSGRVTADVPPGRLPQDSCLAFDVAAGTLLAATSSAVFRVCTDDGGVELVAGSSEDKGSVDCAGAAARFNDISAVLSVFGGRLLIADGPNLRCMDAGGAVTTLLQGCFAGGGEQQLTALPSGGLAALCGGFAESGAAEVALPDADPTAFAHLLSYMYGSSLGLPCTPAQMLLSVPFALLRPTAALAGRLLMEGVVVSAFTDQLAAAATPSTVMASLLWAEDHGLNALAARLRSYAIEHRKTLDLRALEDLVESCPKRAKEVMSKLLRA
ncbi:hypothetical protein HYH03_008403 [Edaphochlamys debaryana]|uniref:BTB domain-containing protein n=1 Tax=Edaphochlamys debaryana TaxID=47281 RepID=A0A835Y361_9CHLO|nr:hypothetical protein HYH03_008403 [Edaphochlamys debaryana]|eukprot:KAG2493266.1 hypothetical protein HYH03_008403 [Edaphochlamys debaryana]